MLICIDCDKKLKSHGKALRCKKCNGLHRKGKFKHTEESKRKISLAKTKNRQATVCKRCNKNINNRTTSGFCSACIRYNKNIIEFADNVINGIQFISIRHQDKNGYFIWDLKCSCGNMFINKSSSIKTGKVKSCGCYNIKHCTELGKKQKGTNSPVWIADRTKTSNFYRNSDALRNAKGSWQYLSRKYKIKNKFKCELTNETITEPGGLEVHHIESVTINPELVIDINNIIAIKKEIHRYFHKIYGKKTTKSNWNSFLTNEYHDFIKGTA